MLLSATWRLLRLLPPGAAYRIVHSAPPGLSRLLARLEGRPRVPGEPVRVFGIELENPVGLAAGLDKDANLTWISWALGLGFSVVGSVLPRPHRGAEKKILRRLPDGGLVNRLGLPSRGASVVAGRLSRHKPPIPVAVNIAALEPEGYVEAYRRVAAYADWVEVNISCPNTVEHGTFEKPEWARRILVSLRGLEPRKPLLLKIPHTRDPDLLTEYASVVVEAGADGVVAGNTLKVRVDGVQAGLSGPRLYEGTLFMVSRLRELLPSRMVVVGVGGVDSRAKVLELLDAGADLVEVLTVLLYHGPGRVRSLLAGGP